MKSNNRNVDGSSETRSMQSQPSYAPFVPAGRTHHGHQQQQQPSREASTSDRNSMVMPGYIRTPHGWYRSSPYTHPQGVNAHAPMYPYRRSQDQYPAHGHGHPATAPNLYRNPNLNPNPNPNPPNSVPTPSRSQTQTQTQTQAQPHIQSRPLARPKTLQPIFDVANNSKDASRENCNVATPLRGTPNVVRASVHSIPMASANAKLSNDAPKPHPNQALLDVTNQSKGNGTRKMIIMKKATSLDIKVAKLEAETEEAEAEVDVASHQGEAEFTPIILEDESSSNLKSVKRCADDLQSLTSASSCSPSTVPSVVSEPYVKKQRSCSLDTTTATQSLQGSVVTTTTTTMATATTDLQQRQAPRGMLDLLCEAAIIVTDRMERGNLKYPTPLLRPHPLPAKYMNERMPKVTQQPRTDPTKKKRKPRAPKSAHLTPIPQVIIKNSPAILNENKKDPSGRGCNCPRSRCIKLYCECFQSGQYCSDKCCCKHCQNNEFHAGPNGPRTRAIQNILARNPYAFHKDKLQLEKKHNSAEGISCRCVRSQCLKLYCECFQSGNVCGDACMCVKCLNTVEESGETGKRTIARSLALLKKPDAFKKKVKEVGAGCSCKNSKCLKKYCDCFNSGLACTPKCQCKDCHNMSPDMLKAFKKEDKLVSSSAVVPVTAVQI